MHGPNTRLPMTGSGLLVMHTTRLPCGMIQSRGLDATSVGSFDSIRVDFDLVPVSSKPIMSLPSTPTELEIWRENLEVKIGLERLSSFIARDPRILSLATTPPTINVFPCYNDLGYVGAMMRDSLSTAARIK